VTIQSRFLRQCAPWLVLLAGWLFIYGPSLAANIHQASPPYVLADDMRIQLPHFYHYRDPTLFVNDPIGKYHSDGTGEFFRWIYIGVGQLLDIVVIGKVLTYVLWFLTAAGVGVAANRLAGKPAAFVAVCLVIGSGVFLDRIVGGLPRAFAYPALAWAAVCLVSGRIRTLALLTVLGAGFYPIIPVICGLALAVVLLVLPRRDRGSARRWSLKQRLAVLGITVAGCAVVIAPFVVRLRPQGAIIRGRDVRKFPEAGPGGRLVAADREPTEPFFSVAEFAATRTVHGLHPLVRSLHAAPGSTRSREPLLPVLAIVTALGALGSGLRRNGRRMRRLAALALAVFIGFELASALHPSLAPTQRYAYLGVPPLVAILVPSAVLGFLPRRWRLPGSLARWTAPAWVLGCGGLLLAALGGRGNVLRCWDVQFSPRERRVFDVLEQLPHSAVIAGFPTRLMDDLPLGAKRAAFINYQMYMPYHQGMTRLMRERASAVLDAYYAPDLAPLKRLRDEFGVTHFLYERVDAHGHALFRPFGTEIKHRVTNLAADNAESAVATYAGQAIVAKQQRWMLLDLGKLQ
jgi:hypothetical protein